MRTLLLLITMLLLQGCEADPFSNKSALDQNNTKGHADDISQNSGFSSSLFSPRTKTEVAGDKVDTNSGVQIQGDGYAVVVFVLGTIAMLLVYHYREENKKSKKALEIISTQMSKSDNKHLKENIIRSSVATSAESIIKKTII